MNPQILLAIALVSLALDQQPTEAKIDYYVCSHRRLVGCRKCCASAKMVTLWEQTGKSGNCICRSRPKRPGELNEKPLCVLFGLFCDQVHRRTGQKSGTEEPQ